MTPKRRDRENLEHYCPFLLFRYMLVRKFDKSHDSKIIHLFRIVEHLKSILNLLSSKLSVDDFRSVKKQLLTSYWLPFLVLMSHPVMIQSWCQVWVWNFYQEINELNSLSFTLQNSAFKCRKDTRTPAIMYACINIKDDFQTKYKLLVSRNPAADRRRTAQCLSEGTGVTGLVSDSVSIAACSTIKPVTNSIISIFGMKRFTDSFQSLLWKRKNI